MPEQQLFDLVITGHESHNADVSLVRGILNLLNEQSPDLELKLAEALIFNNKKLVICERTGIKEVSALQQRLATLAVKSEIRPSVTLKPAPLATVYICPACNHQQAKNETENGRDTCDACGIVGERYNRKLRLQEVIHRERQRYEAEKSKTTRDAGAPNPSLNDEEGLLAEAIRQTGLLPKRSLSLKKIILGAAASVALGGGYYVTQMQGASITLPVVETANKSQGVAGPSGTASTPVATVTPKPVTTEKNTTTVASATTTNNIEPPPKGPTLASNKMYAPSETLLRAFAALEETKSLHAYVSTSTTPFGKDRQRVRRLLKMGERRLAETIIASVKEPYPHSLLLLDAAISNIQRGQSQTAQEVLAEMQTTLTDTVDTTQQVLIMGAISKGFLLMGENDRAAAMLKQAMERIHTLPKGSAQGDLLVQFANEQALLGNAETTRKLLNEAEQLLSDSGSGINATKMAQIISVYALVADFAEAKKRLAKVDDPSKREKLSALIADIETKLEWWTADE
ncbi:hypothetical protein [Thiolinea disciformis]|uniref:hypothetical protein n=1 Tax=Thiolinea disciformis TaxID=125614 RepID=UPI00037B1B45|nr:hypothetical protein [Thiolinea disciformis]